MLTFHLQNLVDEEGSEVIGVMADGKCILDFDKSGNLKLHFLDDTLLMKGFGDSKNKCLTVRMVR